MTNRGTGAGGCNTNQSGKPFEDAIRIVKSGEQYKCFTYVEQADFNRFMKDMYNGTKGCKDFRPDGAYISSDKKKVFLLECKNQQCSGSVDEKILTAPTKLKIYRKKYPGVDFEFAYVLREEWFRQPVYDEWIDTLREEGIHFFWVTGGDLNLKLGYYEFDFTPVDEWLMKSIPPL
jgi:hypothetical protein